MAKGTNKNTLRVIVEGLSFVLHNGDKAALIGEEGNGKSTILKALCNEALVASYAVCEGVVSRGNAIGGYVAQELTEEQWKIFKKKFPKNINFCENRNSKNKNKHPENCKWEKRREKKD